MAFQNLGALLATIDKGTISTNPELGSAFLRAGVAQVAGKGGFTYNKITGLKGQALAEGGTKKASGSASVHRAIPEKFVTSTVYTDETRRFLQGLFQNVVEASPKANGVAYDRILLGIDEKPTEYVAFDTFEGVAEGVVTDLSDFEELINGVPTTGLVGTRAFLGKIRSIVNGLGVRAFNVTGGYGREQDARIDDIPFYILDKGVSTDAFAIAGDYNQLMTQRVYAEDVVIEKNAGNITDINNVEHNLTSQNKSAVMVENWMASAIGSLDDFVKLTVPTAAPTTARTASK